MVTPDVILHYGPEQKKNKAADSIAIQFPTSLGAVRVNKRRPLYMSGFLVILDQKLTGFSSSRAYYMKYVWSKGRKIIDKAIHNYSTTLSSSSTSFSSTTDFFPATFFSSTSDPYSKVSTILSFLPPSHAVSFPPSLSLLFIYELFLFRPLLYHRLLLFHLLLLYISSSSTFPPLSLPPSQSSIFLNDEYRIIPIKIGKRAIHFPP